MSFSVLPISKIILTVAAVAATAAQIYDNIERLRICDPNKVGNRVKFTSYPKCPSAKDYNSDRFNVYGGTVIQFKPNILSAKMHGLKCWLVSSKRDMFTDFWGRSYHRPAREYDKMAAVGIDECKEWFKKKKCSQGPLKLLRTDYKGNKHYSTNNPIVEKSFWETNIISYTHNCFVSEMDIISDSPFTAIRSEDAGLVMTDHKHLFDRQLGVETDTATYVWDQPHKAVVCTYIIWEVYHNITQQFMDNADHFYIILPVVKRNIYINPIKQRVQLKTIDHSYCITQALKSYPDAKLYYTSGHEIIAYMPNNVSLEHLHEFLITNGSVDMTHNIPREPPWHSKTKRVISPSSFSISNGNDRHKRDIHPTFTPKNIEWLTGEETIMEHVRYYVGGEIREWMKSDDKRVFEDWCTEMKYKHDMARIMANMAPSSALSILFGQDVFAKKRGDVYEISKCRHVKENEFTVHNTLKISEKHNLCYSRPILKFIDDNINIEVMGQIGLDKRVIFPPTYTETCKPNSLLYFDVLDKIYLFKNYKLVKNDALNMAVENINIRSKDMPHIVPPITGDVPIYKSEYNETELSGPMDVLDVLMTQNYYRYNSLKIHEYLHNFHQAVGMPPAYSFQQLLTGIESIGSGFTKFFFSILHWFLFDVLLKVIGQILTFIFVICLLIAVIYANILFYAQITASMSSAIDKTIAVAKAKRKFKRQRLAELNKEEGKRLIDYNSDSETD